MALPVRAPVLSGVLLAVAGVGFTEPARANGRIPTGHQIVFSPVDPNTLIMETTFGLLFSHDLGASFQWICEAAVGYSSKAQEDPSMGLTTKLALAGAPEGLFVASDLGCSWTSPVSDPVIDLVVRPDDPHTALMLTSKFTGSVGDAGENLYTTHVLVSHDDGSTWMQQGVDIDPTVLVQTIEVARSDPNRIYLGGATRQLVADGGTYRVAVVLTSINGGASYTTASIALEAPYETQTGAAYVSAVDPSNAGRVYVRIGDSVVDRLVASDDGAATFHTVFQGVGPLLGFALSGDGSKVYVGGPRDGVHLASTSGLDGSASLAFTEQSKASVSCLTWQAGALYACMPQSQSFIQQLGVSTDDGATFDARFLFGCVTGASSCADGSAAVQCEVTLPFITATLGVCQDGGSSDGGTVPIPDAASPDASTPDGSAIAPPRRTPSQGCGCEAGETAGAGGLLTAAGIFTAAALRRRRR
jgi:MYXO-CTERM domain-containing protein